MGFHLGLIVCMPNPVCRIVEASGLIEVFFTEPAFLDHPPVVRLVENEMGAGTEHPVEDFVLDQPARHRRAIAEEDEASIFGLPPVERSHPRIGLQGLLW